MKLIKVLVFSLLAGVAAISCQEKPNPENPTDVAVERIIVSPSDTTLTVGDTLQLDITVLPENATNKNFKIGMSATKIIEIIEDNQILAAKAGEGAIVTIVSEADNSIQATCTISVVEKTDEPTPGPDDPPGPEEPVDSTERRPDSDFDFVFDNGYRTKILKTTENDIWFELDFPADAGEFPMCFVWGEPKNVLEGKSSQELISYAQDVVFSEIMEASKTFKLDSLMEQNAVNLATCSLIKLSVITTAYPFGGEAIHLRDITPDTEYRFFGFSVNEKGEAISDAFFFDCSTEAPINEDRISVEYTTPHDIVIDLNVVNKQLPYWLHYRPASEVEGFRDSDIFRLDVREFIEPYADMYGMSIGEYIAEFGTRGALDNFHILSSECLEPDTEYVVYFFRISSDNKLSGDVMKVNARTEAIVPSGVTFEAEVDYSTSMPTVKITPSDPEAYYLLEGVTVGRFADYTTAPTDEEAIDRILYGQRTAWDGGYYGGLVGNASLGDDILYSTESYLVGSPNQRGVLRKGTVNVSAGGQDSDGLRNENDPINGLYSGLEGEALHVIVCTVDPKTGAITSDPQVLVIVDVKNK